MLGVAGTVLLSVIVMLLWIQITGAAIVAPRALALVDTLFAGKIDAEEVHFWLSGKVEARGVRILDPEGRVVIRAETVSTRVDLLPIARLRIQIHSPRIEGAEMYLSNGPDGVNIARVFGLKQAPKHPSPPPATPRNGSGPGVSVVIDDILVHSKTLQFSAPPGEPPAVALDGAAVTGHFELTPEADLLISGVITDGQLRGPARGAVTLDGHFAMLGDTLAASAKASLDDAKLEAEAKLDLKTLAGRAQVASLDVGPKLAARYLGALAPKGAHAVATATLDRTLVTLETLNVAASGGSGSIGATGSLDLSSGEGQAQVHGTDTDLGAFFGVFPRTAVTLDAQARVSALFTDHRSGTAHVTVHPSRWNGQAIDASEVDAAFDGRRVSLHRAHVLLPGAQLEARGSYDDGAIFAEGQFAIADLHALGVAVDRVAGVALRPVTGDVGGSFALHGSLRELAATVDVEAKRLGVGSFVARDLAIHLAAPRLGRHLALHGEVQVGALPLGAAELDDLALAADWSEGSLTVAGNGWWGRGSGNAFALRTRLELPEDFRSAALAELSVRLPGGTWTLAQPVAVRFDPAFAFDGLQLSSGDQRLSAGMAAGAHGIEVTGSIDNLDLAKLPRVTSLVSGGTVSASGKYATAGGKPQATATFQASGLRLGAVQVPAIAGKAALGGRQLTVDATADLKSGRVAASASTSLPIGKGEVTSKVQLAGVSLGELSGWAPHGPQLKGTVAGELELGGTWARPSLTAQLKGADVAGLWAILGETMRRGSGTAPLEPFDAAIAVTVSEQGTRIGADIEGTSGEEVLKLDATSPAGPALLGALLTTPAAALPALRTAPFDAQLDLALEAASAGALAGVFNGELGPLRLKAKLHGSATGPRGEVELTAQQLGFGGVSLGDVSARGAATDSGLTLTATLVPPGEGGRPAGQVRASGSWAVPIEALGQAQVRSHAPLKATVEADQLALGPLLGGRRQVQGEGKLRAALEGSLAAPRGAASVAFADLVSGGVPVGELSARLKWDGVTLEGGAEAAQPKGGRLKAALILPIGAGVAANAPLRATLTAADFELGFASPLLSQARVLRALAGRLDADLTATGTRGAPQLNGTFALAEGAVAWPAVGELRHVALSGKVSPGTLTIDKLSVSSAGGPLTGALRARHGDAGWKIDGQFDARRFGIYLEDQLRGLVSGQIAVAGNFSPKARNADINLSNIDVHLTSLMQRELSPMGLPDDIRLQPVAALAPAPSIAVPFWLHLYAPGPVTIDGPDLKLQTRADLTVSLPAVLLSGRAEVSKGEVDAYGHDFKVEKAVVTFGEDGSFVKPGDGILLARAEKDIDGNKLAVVVSGRLSHPVPLLTSEPPMPSAAVARLLLSGSSDSSRQQAGGLSLVGDLLTEQVQKALGYRVPLDVLSLEPSRLEAGKRITSKLYLGLTYKIGVNDPRVNNSEVHARYDLFKAWAVDGRYGDAQAGNLDLVWHHSW